MISIDYRTGSAELASGLRSRRLPVELVTLGYGDVSFLGNGPEGCPVPVGIEFKQVMDVLKCITDGRFSGHQLPGLISSYTVVWLLIEGNFRPCVHTGKLQRLNNRCQWVDASVGQRGFMYRDFIHWIQTIGAKGGVNVWRTSDRTETLAWIHGVYTWWTAKEWEEHRSHAYIGRNALFDSNVFGSVIRPSLCRRVAAELPGVGTEKSLAVAEHFQGSIEAMFCAPIREWCNISGIGKTMAERIWRALHE